MSKNYRYPVISVWLSGRFPRVGFLLLAILTLGACAISSSEEFKPRVGQEGKDVVWVPSPQIVVERMLDIAKVTPADFVMDLGSGDGRNVIAAGKRGARGVGVEFNPNMVILSNREAEKAGVADRVSFVQGDMYVADISRASVLALFLLPENLRRLEPNFLNLKPGTRIVVNYFGIPGWDADYREELTSGCEVWCSVLLYIVPAKVEGTWRFGQSALEIRQDRQKLSGTLIEGATRIEFSDGRMDGDRISLKAGENLFSGRVFGNRIEGERKTAAGAVPWVGFWQR